MADQKAITSARHDHIRRATHGSPDHPLKIGGREIPCYVLEDGTRVITKLERMDGRINTLTYMIGANIAVCLIILGKLLIP